MPAAQQAYSISVDVVTDLPPLAWLAALEPRGATLLCGADVETFPEGWFEGCWAGSFGERRYNAACHVFGSGCKIVDGRPLFVTPWHTLDALYVLHRKNRFAVSNSLAFLVRFSSIELPYDFEIGRRFTSIKKGVTHYERVVSEGPDWTLYRIVHHNFDLRDGVLRTVPKPPEPAFEDYASYKGVLKSTLRAVGENGAAPGRKARYSLITTCSSGYDSTACAALAASLGCRQALTLGTARSGRSDSGSAVAEALGLELVELERPGRARGTEFEEAEFFATGMGGEDYVFLGFGPYCHRRIVLTGFHGDVVWKRHAKPANNIARKDVSGSNLTELRLRHGFVHVPVPFVAATRHDALLRIAESEEMNPYQVGGPYDRPVPRRVAEEQGVPRGSFATTKKAGSIVFDWLSIFWSPNTLQDLKRFEGRLLSRGGVSRTRYYAGWVGQTAALVGAQLVSMSSARVKFSGFRLSKVLNSLMAPMTERYRYNHPRYDNMAFLWAVERIGERYPTEEIWRASGDRRKAEAA
jgi:hypothetical protein